MKYANLKQRVETLEQTRDRMTEKNLSLLDALEKDRRQILALSPDADVSEFDDLLPKPFTMEEIERMGLVNDYVLPVWGSVWTAGRTR